MCDDYALTKLNTTYCTYVKTSERHGKVFGLAAGDRKKLTTKNTDIKIRDHFVTVFVR